MGSIGMNAAAAQSPYRLHKILRADHWNPIDGAHGPHCLGSIDIRRPRAYDNPCDPRPLTGSDDGSQIAGILQILQHHQQRTGRFQQLLQSMPRPLYDAQDALRGLGVRHFRKHLLRHRLIARPIQLPHQLRLPSGLLQRLLRNIDFRDGLLGSFTEHLEAFHQKDARLTPLLRLCLPLRHLSDPWI